MRGAHSFMNAAASRFVPPAEDGSVLAEGPLDRLYEAELGVRRGAPDLRQGGGPIVVGAHSPSSLSE